MSGNVPVDFSIVGIPAKVISGPQQYAKNLLIPHAAKSARLDAGNIVARHIAAGAGWQVDPGVGAINASFRDSVSGVNRGRTPFTCA